MRVTPLFLEAHERVQGPLALGLGAGGNALLFDDRWDPARLFVASGAGFGLGEGPSLIFSPVSGRSRNDRDRGPRRGRGYWEGEPMPAAGPSELSSWAGAALEAAGRTRTSARPETCRWQLPPGELRPQVLGFCSIDGRGPRPDALVVFERSSGRPDLLRRIWLAPRVADFSFGDPGRVLAVDLDGDEHPELWFEGELELGERRVRHWLLLVDTGHDLIGPFRVVRDGCAREEE